VDTETAWILQLAVDHQPVFDPSIQSWILKLTRIIGDRQWKTVFDPSIQSWILKQFAAVLGGLNVLVFDPSIQSWILKRMKNNGKAQA